MQLTYTNVCTACKGPIYIAKPVTKSLKKKPAEGYLPPKLGVKSMYI